MTELLARPIEITDDNKNASVNINGSGAQALTLDVGVYGCILTMLKGLETELQALTTGANFSVRLTDDFKVKIAHSSLTFVITWSDTDLGRLLGWRDNIGIPTSSETATDTPENIWLPSFWSSDGSYWAVDQTNVVATTNVVGQTSAVKLTDDMYAREITWDAQDSANVYKDAWTTSFTWSTVFYPEQTRCLENLSMLSRSATLSAEASENVNPKGTYFIKDTDDWTGDAPTNALPATMDSGGIDADYLFCSIATKGMGAPTRSSDRSRAHHNVSVDLKSATAPTWLV